MTGKGGGEDFFFFLQVPGDATWQRGGGGSNHLEGTEENIIKKRA